jgi:hypothetical protein
MSEQKERICKAVIVAAQLAGRDLSQDAVEFYAARLKDLPLLPVLKAIAAAGDAGKLPTVKDIRTAVEGEPVSAKAEATEAANRIISAMSRHGRPNGAAARGAIGELGWAVVEQFGGWETLCDRVTHNDQLPTLTAQLRDTAMGIHEKAAKGALGTLPGLPAANTRNAGLTPVRDVLAAILAPKEDP